MQATKTLITAEEFYEIAPKLGHCELVKGEIIEMAPTGLVHGKIAMKVGTRLSNYVEAQELGVVFAAETGFIVEPATDGDARDTVRGPDVAYVSQEQIPEEGLDDAWGNFPPDLAVEVVSKNDREKQVLEKVGEYLDAGVRLVWVVRPKDKTVTIYRPNGDVELLHASDTLTGEDVVPGFSYSVSEIFS